MNPFQSDCSRGHEAQGTRLGVGFLRCLCVRLTYLCVCAYAVASVMTDSLQPHGLWAATLPVHGILQARILEWDATPSSRGSSQPRDRTCMSYVSYIAGWITGATWEALTLLYSSCVLPQKSRLRDVLIKMVVWGPGVTHSLRSYPGLVLCWRWKGRYVSVPLRPSVFFLVKWESW